MIDVDLDFIVNSADLDNDNDGLSDQDELTVYMTDPLLADTDGDGFSDYQELINFLTNPFIVDTDNDTDGLPDAFDTDDDNDGLSDQDE